MGQAFEQQPKESAKAFAAFSVYLNMGAKRSLEAVRLECGKSSRLIQRWSSRWKWTERVQAHAGHLAAVERASIEGVAREKAIEWHKVHEEQRIAEWKARCDALELAQRAIARWRKNENKCGTLEGIARLLELASRLGRLASGMPTESVEVTGEIKATLEIEWELALKKVYGVAKPARPVVEVEAVESKGLLAPGVTGESEAKP